MRSSRTVRRVSQSFVVTVTSSAAPEQVFAVLADGSRWCEWAGPLVRRSMWEREGEPAPGGVGAIRRLGRAGVYGREQIVEYDAPRRLSYVILSGQPVRHYRADVDLVPDGGGTRIEWRGDFEPTVPLTGTAMRWYFAAIVRGFARRLARHAATGF